MFMALPVKVRGDTVVTFADVATNPAHLRKTATGLPVAAPALALRSKTVRFHIIETVAAVRSA